MPFSAPVLTYRAKGLASNIQSKVLKVHNTLININITAILAPEMTYTPKSQRKGQEKCVYMNQCQDKTNPSLVTGLRCKLYTRNPFEYRRLCELVLGWRVLRGNKCVTRARGNIFQPFPRRGQRCIYMNVYARREQRPNSLGLCRAAAKRLLKTNVLLLKNWSLFSSLTNISYRGRIELKTFCIFAALFLILQCCLLIELIYALR